MKPTMQEREVALSVVRVLFSYGFKSALSYETGELGYYKWMHEEKNEELLRHCDLNITCGASKVCIYTDDEEDNWVIKIGFMRETNSAFARSGRIQNFCRLEAINYNKAVKEGCDEHLAATYYCGNVDDVDIYLQEKVEICEDLFEDKIYNYVSSMYDENEYPDEDERQDYIVTYLEDECNSEDQIMAILGDTTDSRKLVEFCDDNNINDLHALNWGIAKDRRIVLIDFSGYM